MSRKRIAAIGTGLVLAVGAVAGGSTAALTGGGGDDPPLTGSTLDQATAAALAQTPGTVIETEVGDGGAAYGVEIRKDDGTVVEVNLDENFNVIGQEVDEDGPNDIDGPNDN